MITVLIILTSFGLLCPVDSRPSKKQHKDIIFPEIEDDIPVHTTKSESAPNKKHYIDIKFPDYEILINQNSTTAVVKEELQYITELPKSPIRKLFLELYNKTNFSSEYKTFRRTSNSVMEFFDNFLFGVSLRLSITALKSGAG